MAELFLGDRLADLTIRWLMTDDHAPYVQWEETLPEGNRAKLIICPGENTVGIVMHWNNQLRHVETVDTRELAEARGWELRKQVLSGDVGR